MPTQLQHRRLEPRHYTFREVLKTRWTALPGKLQVGGDADLAPSRTPATTSATGRPPRRKGPEFEDLDADGVKDEGEQGWRTGTITPT